MSVYFLTSSITSTAFVLTELSLGLMFSALHALVWLVYHGYPGIMSMINVLLMVEIYHDRCHYARMITSLSIGRLMDPSPRCPVLIWLYAFGFASPTYM